MTRQVYPRVTPVHVLVACAQAYLLHPEEMIGRKRGQDLQRSRHSFVHIGKLEGFTDAQLAAFLGRSRSRVTHIFSEPIPEDQIRVPRTLLWYGNLMDKLNVQVGQALDAQMGS